MEVEIANGADLHFQRPCSPGQNFDIPGFEVFLPLLDGADVTFFIGRNTVCTCGYLTGHLWQASIAKKE
jgi:hypothetical protein